MADSSTSIGSMAENVTGSFASLANLITASSYLAGIGFSAASILKFKSHKDNPTQIPVGTPVALLATSAILTFLPSLKGTASAAGVTTSEVEAAAKSAGVTAEKVESAAESAGVTKEKVEAEAEAAGATASQVSAAESKLKAKLSG
ncbi:MAG TPA: hypothetical protein VHG08_04380 [Longimicrobium sp.]|nr:hypothetical protein [Longimicrobium sp.]